MLKLLNELQPEVNECHRSEEGQILLAKIQEKQKIQNVILASRQREAINKKRKAENEKEVQKESERLQEARRNRLKNQVGNASGVR